MHSILLSVFLLLPVASISIASISISSLIVFLPFEINPFVIILIKRLLTYILVIEVLRSFATFYRRKEAALLLFIEFVYCTLAIESLLRINYLDKLFHIQSLGYFFCILYVISLAIMHTETPGE